MRRFWIRNDAQSLYLCIQAADSQATRQEIGSGLLVSLEPEGGKSRRLAIRYPAGFFGQGAREPGEEGGPPPEGAAPGRERWSREDLLNRSLGQVEILGPGKDDRNILAVRELREAAVAYGSDGGWEKPPGEDGGRGGDGGGGRPPGGRHRHGEPVHGSIKFQLAPAPSGAGGR